jgi:hypothetical protein
MPAQVADCKAANELLERLPAVDVRNGDKGYDPHLIRRRGTLPKHPAHTSGRNCFSLVL